MSVAARLIAFAEDAPNPFQDQLDYFRQKVSLPTKGYADVMGRAHDRAFVVAGVERDDVLTDIRQAVEAGIGKGETLAQFQKRFDKIVQQKGWIGGAGNESDERRAWRARMIYETNLRGSYMAGRLKQLRDPDVLRAYPYWQYIHADLREPKIPRWTHLSWNGLILLADSDWWKTHFPPNGWLCTCGIRPISRVALRRLRGAKAEPDATPPIIMETRRDPKTGLDIQVPQGIDTGFDHMPGDSWERGLVPPELQKPLPPSSALPEGARGNPPIRDLPPLSEISDTSKLKPLPEGKEAEFYVDAVLGAFGAARGENGAALYRDKAGGAVIISESMFKDPAGAWKVFKGKRATDLARGGEAIRDPDEIWVDWEQNHTTGEVTMRRRYVRQDGDSRFVSVFEWGKDGWRAVTLHSADAEGGKRRDAYVNNQRHGALLYRREK